MALCALALTFAATRAGAEKPERIPMSLDCRTLGERSRESDCHSFDIFAKRAFFDSPLRRRAAVHPRMARCAMNIRSHLTMPAASS